MGARTWQQLQVLVQSYKASFNHIHVSALVCRLPKVVVPTELPTDEKARFSAFLRNVSDLVSVRLSSFDPRAIANVLWAVSKLGYSPAPPLLNKFLFEAYVHMYDFKAQELANLSWALATLAAMGNRPVPVWLRKFTQAAVPQVEHLKPQEVAHMLWALSKLYPPSSASPVVASAPPGSPPFAPAPSSAAPDPTQSAPMPPRTIHNNSPHYTTAATLAAADGGGQLGVTDSTGPSPPPPATASEGALPELVAALAAHAAACLQRFRCGELVMTVLALHTLHPVAGAQLLRRALPHLLAAGAEELSQQDIANLWMVLGKCALAGLLPGEVVAPRDQAGTDAGPYAASSARQGQQQHWQGNKALAAGSSYRLSGTLAARGGSTVSNSGILAKYGSHDGGSGRSGTNRQAMVPSGLYGGGASQRGGTPVVAAATAVLAESSSPPCCDLARQHLYALAELTELSLPGFSAQGLCIVLVAWARLRLRPSSRAVHALLLRLYQVLPAQATFNCLAVSLWAAARLRLRPDPRLVGFMLACAQLQLPTARPCELVALMWALQELLFRPGRGFFRRLGWRLSEVAEEVMPHGVHVVVKAFSTFGEPLPPAVRSRAMQVATDVAAEGLAAEAEAEDRRRAWHGPRRTEASGPCVPPAMALPNGIASTTTAASSSVLTTAPSQRLHHYPAAAPPPSLASSAAVPLAAQGPSVIVRFFATLAGVGLPKPHRSSRGAASRQTLSFLRWRLSANAAKRRALGLGLERALAGRLSHLSTDALCSLLISMARLRLRPRAAFLREVHSEAADRITDLAPWQAGTLLRAFAALNARPPAEWLPQVLGRMQAGLGALTNRQLLGVLAALATLRYRPSAGWMRAYFEECMARLHSWPAGALGAFLRGLATLGLRLSNSPCERLRLVVATKEQGRVVATAAAAVGRKGGRARWGRRAQWARGRGGKGGRPAAPGRSLKRSLCSVCAELSGCEV